MGMWLYPLRLYTTLNTGIHKSTDPVLCPFSYFLRCSCSALGLKSSGKAGFRIHIHLIWILIRIQHFRLNTNSDPGFYDQKSKKINSWKIFLWSKTTIYLYLGLHKGRPSYKRSLQLSKENIQHFKTWNFIIFSLLRVIFALLDPDPDSEYGSGSGSTDLIESGYSPDPDPDLKPCGKAQKIKSNQIKSLFSFSSRYNRIVIAANNINFSQHCITHTLYMI
jgi:hypothetical protein